METEEKMKSIHIPAGYYFRKSQVAKILNIPLATLQYHIGKGNIPTVHIPDLGHIINEREVLKFKKALHEIKRGRPSIYRKVK